MQIVPVTTLEEIEHALLSRQIADTLSELAILQRELEPLERAFAAFEQKVARQSAAITAERDRLRLICAEIERFTSRLHARLMADPDGMMSSVFTPDELRYIGDLFGIDMSPEVVDPASRATTSERGWEWADASDTSRHETTRSNGNHPDLAELRSLYRQLARTFHPDLTTDPAERHVRQEMMLRINTAWDLRDARAMQAIRDDVYDLLAGSLMSAGAYRLAWKRRELAQLQQACQTCRGRIEALRYSKTITLWHDATLANAAIARHIKRLEMEVAGLRVTQQHVVEEFRLALGSYAAHRA